MVSNNEVFLNESNELPSVHSANDLINKVHTSAIVSEIRNNKEIQEKFIDYARKAVDNELNTMHQESTHRRQKTTYDVNKEACRLYGIDEHVALWQVRLMKTGTGFWFVIYWLFASLIIVPINVFFKGIKTFVSNNYIVFVFAVVCYLIIVIGIPLLMRLI